MRNVHHYLSESMVLRLPFKVFITIPAIWPEYAKDRMRQAVDSAGILHRDFPSPGKTELHFIYEPEAAALATFSDYQYYEYMKVGRFASSPLSSRISPANQSRSVIYLLFAMQVKAQ